MSKWGCPALIDQRVQHSELFEDSTITSVSDFLQQDAGQLELTLTLIYILVVGKFGLSTGSGGITQSDVHTTSRVHQTINVHAPLPKSWSTQTRLEPYPSSFAQWKEGRKIYMYALTKPYGSCRGSGGSDMHKQNKNQNREIKHPTAECRKA